VQARPRLGSLGQACGLRGALDGAVHADKDICMVASREARFSGSLLGLLTTAVVTCPAAQLLGFLFRRVKLSRRPKMRSTSLLVDGRCWCRCWSAAGADDDADRCMILSQTLSPSEESERLSPSPDIAPA
jgi:hypothetical protein